MRVGAGYAVVTPQGTISAENVLIATNGYTDEAVREIGKRVFPLGSYIVATEPLPEDVAAKLIPQRRVVFDPSIISIIFACRPIIGCCSVAVPLQAAHAGGQSQERRYFAAGHGAGLSRIEGRQG